MKSIRRSAAEWAVLIACAAALYALIHFCVFEVAIIEGDSMYPTLTDQERVVVFKLPYITGSPRRGDIVAFPYPADTSRSFVKRVVGAPGDLIEADAMGVYVNGELLRDAFAETPPIMLGDADYPMTVPPDSYFVLGDNRAVSHDSRYGDVGMIRKSDILGKVALRMAGLSPIE
ncbi:MAG: signal peptidase I [Clostridiales bacterium]|jgi:signal peptidase I|nr:signal peptidase I [Clostridiales bacterium]